MPNTTIIDITFRVKITGFADQRLIDRLAQLMEGGFRELRELGVAPDNTKELIALYEETEISLIDNQARIVESNLLPFVDDCG